ncbi:aminotransferase class I/II-fold pyridoxal phosphate-dependent enzyme [Streptomyces sp. NPDC006879]|uniref:aminotransferase class I/II-fold pyridoxal phosphate-dependent enzyme n=1 Tax=Streptomyces sp. NPDC006879 TaxID=3364767 RepID=UPI00369D20F3
MLGEYMITGRRASEISASVEAGVGSEELAPGAVLPPMRELAARLGVNPNTVAAAYRSLRERGVIETDGRRGSRVRTRPASTLHGSIRAHVSPGVRDVSSGNPDPTLLPDLSGALAAAARRHAARPALYGEGAVLPELATLAGEGLEADGVPVGKIAVTSGALDAVERVLAAHLRPGDAVAVEDPGWGALLDLVPALGLRLEPVAIDEEGPLPEAVEGALRRGARALVVTDRAQNPSGGALSEARAEVLRGVLAGHRETLVIDDDNGHAISSVPLHSLCGATRHWVLVRSTAKVLGPDLRLAVLTGDAVTVDRVSGRQQLGQGWVSKLLQYTVVDLWATRAVDPVAVARSYDGRREGLVAALRERGVPAVGRTGMNVWVPVPEETGTTTRLLAAGWAAAPGARFRTRASPGLRLTVSSLQQREVEELAAAVALATGPLPGLRFG